MAATQKSTETKSAGAKKKVDVINFDKFEIDRFTLEPIFDDPKSKISSQNQLLSFPRYNYSKTSAPDKKQLTLVTGKFKITKYGMSRKTDPKQESKSKFNRAQTVSDEAWMRVGLDESQPATLAIMKATEALDQKCVAGKEEMFKGTKYAKFSKLYSEYVSIVRSPQASIDDEDDGKKSDETGMKYVKFKFDVDYNTDQIKTAVFLHEDGYPKKQNVKTVDQLRELVTYMSTVRLIVQASKVWLAKSGDSNNKRKYGLTFKIKQIDIIERGKSNTEKDSFDDYMFDACDDDETKETTPAKETPKEVETPKKAASVKKEESEDEEEEEEEEEEESEEEKPAPKKASGKKK